MKPDPDCSEIKTSSMSSQSRKAEVRKLLEGRDFEALEEWAGAVRNPFRILLSLTYEVEGLLRWRTIEAVGKTAKIQAALNIEKVRDFVRRLLWLMNDESGGLGWFAPEMIGEILVNVPVLIESTADILPSFIKEEPFERGAHLAICRVASIDARPFLKFAPEISESLDNSDPLIRSYAALILAAIGAKQYREPMKNLLDDRTKVILYDFDGGNLEETTVSNIARKAIKQIDSSSEAA